MQFDADRWIGRRAEEKKALIIVHHFPYIS